MIENYKGLRVYRNAMDAAMEIYHVTKRFPIEEKYSMVDQIRRSSRSVCANLAEAWRKRRYEASFIAKLSDSETQVWVEFANRCGYLDDAKTSKFDDAYDHIVAQLVIMIAESKKWVIKP